MASATAILKITLNSNLQNTHNDSPSKFPNSIERPEFSAKILKLCSENGLNESMGSLDLIPKTGIFPQKLRFYDHLLRSVASKRDLSLANKVYEHITGSHLHRNDYFETKIVSMFVKCGSLDTALQVFDGITVKSLYLWSVILNGFCGNGQFNDALKLFRNFSHTDLRADGFVLSSVLRACGGSGNSRLGREVHAFVYRNGYASDLFVNNCLVDAYGKWGQVDVARTIFDRIPHRDIVSWNSMLKSYSRSEDYDGFSRLVKDFETEEGVKPNLITWNTIISGYAVYSRAKEALNCFYKMQSMGMKPDVVSCNALISALAQNEYFKYALELVQQMVVVGLEPDIVSWTTLIGGYVNSGYFKEALSLLSHVQSSGLILDEFIFSLLLKACSGLLALKQGCEIHGHIIRNGSQIGAVLSASLIDMYAKCGKLDCARYLLSRNNVVSWNSLISGYIWNGNLGEAKKLLQQLQLEPLKPDLVSWNLMISCYAQEGDDDKALDVLDRMQSIGIEPNSLSWISFLNGYAERGQFGIALDLLNQKDLTGYKQYTCSWNLLISAYVKDGMGEEALRAFYLMKSHKVEPDLITISCILHACALIGALRIGKSVHGWIIRRNSQDKYTTSGLLEMYIKSDALRTARKLFSMISESNLVLWNGMISALAKSGRMHEARMLFHEMGSVKLNPDVVSWTSMILGYIRSGNANVALEMWVKMWQSGVQPDAIALTAASTACANMGTVETAKEFHGLSITIGLEKDPSVQASLVNMYLKCGSINEAESILRRSPVWCTSIWNSMISRYGMHRHGESSLSLSKNLK